MSQWEMIIRLVLSGVLGGLIGFERRSHFKEAGLRTHFVVAVGSALIMLVSKYGFTDLLYTNAISVDPSRIAAQVVSGIGFLGAGTIIVEHQFVRGLTTAAGLWATAGIGIAIGAGMYIPGISATVLILVALEIFNKFKKTVSYSMGRADLSPDGINPALDTLKNSKIKISGIQVNRHYNKTDKDLEVRLTFRIYTKNQNETKKIMVSLLKIPYVKNVNIE
ncbi:MgtC/SapB family protein [Clostridium sp. WLY-B-L2]|uniref:MgtC/SapB family protein n=1 Tax=Clostridium aromativorans TaxID=2836848 RepID=A0ABS8N952_9CLOT|nr:MULTISPECIES: MgtC/SapB family protein [Clostridium]KAA8671581.1 methyltransferase [Clostridium sp. HV4-5-A1G]MCC9296320.1 MgtC/SapB family protein [Clostridium aromativorans]CAB1262579.1 Putative magnesium transporter YhiD [Clostridiaceae bacterium BL-3]